MQCERGGPAVVERVGGHHPIVWGVEWIGTKTNKNKYIVALIGCQLANQHMATNQK